MIGGMNSAQSWITLCGARDQALGQELEDRVAQKIAAKEFTIDNVEYVSKIDLKPIKGKLELSEIELEKLRAMCSLWALELRPISITSHRKFIGPLIVGAKKLIFPIIRIFMRETLQQQSRFNAATIALVAELANSRSSKPSANAQK